MPSTGISGSQSFLKSFFSFPTIKWAGLLSITLLDDMLPALTGGLTVTQTKAFLFTGWFSSVFCCMSEQLTNTQIPLCTNPMEVSYSAFLSHQEHMTSYKSHIFLHFFYIPLLFHVEGEGRGEAHACHMCSQETARELVLSFRPMDPGNQTGVIRLIGECLYPLSHRTGPISTVLNK